MNKVIIDNNSNSMLNAVCSTWLNKHQIYDDFCKEMCTFRGMIFRSKNSTYKFISDYTHQIEDLISIEEYIKNLIEDLPSNKPYYIYYTKTSMNGTSSSGYWDILLWEKL